jgi:hypothetical protein
MPTQSRGHGTEEERDPFLALRVVIALPIRVPI